jgi:hypothetical protein
MGHPMFEPGSYHDIELIAGVVLRAGTMGGAALAGYPGATPIMSIDEFYNLWRSLTLVNEERAKGEYRYATGADVVNVISTGRAGPIELRTFGGELFLSLTPGQLVALLAALERRFAGCHSSAEFYVRIALN